MWELNEAYPGAKHFLWLHDALSQDELDWRQGLEGFGY